MQRVFYVSSKGNVVNVISSIKHINDFIEDTGTIVSVTGSDESWIVVAEKNDKG
jgi:hypothetical protein